MSDPQAVIAATIREHPDPATHGCSWCHDDGSVKIPSCCWDNEDRHPEHLAAEIDKALGGLQREDEAAHWEVEGHFPDRHRYVTSYQTPADPEGNQ